tara:strand:- start:70 stop:324 length:255 start_codon:yes stop_codon:yes gene_type:complete
MKKYTIRRIEKRYVDYTVEANSDEEAYNIVEVDYDEDKILSIDLGEECVDEAKLGVEQVIDLEARAKTAHEMWGPEGLMRADRN